VADTSWWRPPSSPSAAGMKAKQGRQASSICEQ
jgi:hypothetical protein